MGRTPITRHHRTKCAGCGRYVTNLRKHMSKTQCHLMMTANNNEGCQDSNKTDDLIGMHVGYKVNIGLPSDTINNPSLVQLNRSQYKNSSNNSLFKKPSLSPHPGKDSLSFTPPLQQCPITLPVPDFQSVSVLSVQTGQKESGPFHDELRDLNKGISYEALDDNDNSDNEIAFDNVDIDSSNKVLNNESINCNNSMQQSLANCHGNNNVSPAIVSNRFEGNLKIRIDDPCYDLLQSKSFISYTKTYNVLCQAKVPLYCFDLIIKTIGHEIVSRNFDPSDPDYSRKQFLNDIYKQFPTPKPQIVPVHLDSRWNDSIHSNP